MARRSKSADTPPVTPEQNIIDIDVSAEMETSFLEYAYSVIYSRALPDARDGLKPVQRRILYMMSDMGLRPEKGHVKSARVVGEVMGKLHPHGDAAIYDALVRMAQSFALRLPLVDGHGNFGSLDDGPAAPRYTEARMTAPALSMTADLDEDVVDFEPNYDNQLTQPGVLPSAFPNLLVNGASGIAVGMATNMPPHNMREVINGAKHLILHPESTLEDLIHHIPGPDLPSGGRIVGLEGIRDAYRTGRGTFKTRAKVSIEQVSARKTGIVVTQLPYMVGPEKVIEKIKDAVQAKKLTGISDVLDLTDRKHGLRMIIELKAGFNPQAVLGQLYRYTPLEDSFGINNVALVDGQPRTLGLLEMLQVYVDHRLNVVRRRSAYRLRKRQARLHLVEGLLIAILDIDEVIQIIRAAEDTAAARARLMTIFDLSQAQADHILELRLRQLTRYSALELEQEKERLEAEIAELEAILGSEDRLRNLVAAELDEVAAKYGDDRRTELLDAEAAPAVSAQPDPAAPAAGSSLQIPDAPCWAVLSSSGQLARTTNRSSLVHPTRRARHDALSSVVPTSSRGEIGAVTSAGRMIRVPVVDMPAVEMSSGTVNLNQGVKAKEFLHLEKAEELLAFVPLDAVIALGTAQGRVKRVNPDYPLNRDDWEVISLKGEGRAQDRVIGAAVAADDADQLCFITAGAQLLRFEAALVRAQGRTAAGMLGIKLAPEDTVIGFSVVPAAGAPEDAEASTTALVVTLAAGDTPLEGFEAGSIKLTDFAEFPAKGRGTAGVRAHRFMRGEDHLKLGWAGIGPALGAARNGVARNLPSEMVRRDGSGIPLERGVDAVAPSPEALAAAAVGAT
ncbi:DNA topoisomerase IV subunit A [Nesterenkonia sp. E16_7]|uniref:DNA gyrase/topoisomerase IV subunit A n=1 Tax=unclassified Nesterenkonia TaxID=2629769 RepID=UPI001A91D748|nr:MULTISPECIES: DNA topoisomerase IV subunit A [unclassified Nesterenkonia]MBO0596046.1 DNA topoisomerase IV subunit A [Nesterenkonia sp. E16_10]MBO0599354.1 DNA topoisomerase IV subunit A [Nesterenkonia sp. E16_7]